MRIMNIAAKMAAKTIIAVKTFPWIEDPNAIDLIVIVVDAVAFQGSEAVKTSSVSPSSFVIPLIYGIVSSNCIQSGNGSRVYVNSSPSSSMKVVYDMILVNCYPTIVSIMIGSCSFKYGLLFGTPDPAMM